MHNNKRRDEMNKHIELVKKWLDDPESVTLQELKDNAETVSAASAAAAWSAYVADANPAYSVYAAAAWVKKYEELEK